MQTKMGVPLKLLGALVSGLAGLFLLFGTLPAENPSLLLAPPAAYAQGPIVLDGIASPGEWDGQRLITHPLNVRITAGHTCNGQPAGNTHPTDPPCFAHTGYDVTALWALYQTLDDSWYFRIDLDGVVGDVDSVQGVDALNLGSGTSGPDGGLLMAFGSDAPGLGPEERYALFFGPSAVSLPDRAEVTSAPAGPGVTFTLSGPISTLTGEAIYSTTVPGVLEWRIDRASLLPAGVVQPELWIGAEAGASNDRVSEDGTMAIPVLAIDIVNVCPTPFVVGEPATFDIDFSIAPTSTYPIASNVVITAPVPAGTTYVSCSGGPCVESSGVITWTLGTLPRGTASTVSFNAVPNVTSGITTDAFITIAEGLRDQTSAAGCTAQQPTPTFTPTPTQPTPTSTSTPLPTDTPMPPEPTPKEKDDETPPPPAPAPIPTFTATPLAPPTPTPMVPTQLPETGALPDRLVLAGLALLAGTLLFGLGVRVGKRNRLE